MAPICLLRARGMGKMSAVIAGTKCRGCGNSYYVSLGHPKWFDDVVKHNKPKSELFKQFEELQASGFCPPCYAGEGLNEKDR